MRSAEGRSVCWDEASISADLTWKLAPSMQQPPQASFRRYLRSSSCRSIPENLRITSEFPSHFHVKVVTLLGHIDQAVTRK